MKTITMIGAGSWGSAVAIALSKVAKVNLFSIDEQQVNHMRECRNNPDYLPQSITFNDNVSFHSVLTSEILDVDLVVVGTPLNAVRIVLGNIKKLVSNLPNMIFLSKGLEANTGLLTHEIIEQVLPGFNDFGVLIGPSFAKEVALSLPTAITLASFNIDFAKRWMNELKGIPNLRIYANDDVIGGEVGSAVKNVLAIAVGISDGLKLGYNARAGLITRSLNELALLVTSLGGKTNTIYGLTGIGDLILTCTGDLSRNRTVGLELAKGYSLDDIVTNLGHVAEGVSTTKEVYNQAQKLNIEMPIVNCVYRILYEGVDIKTEINGLITREVKLEF